MVATSNLAAGLAVGLGEIAVLGAIIVAARLIRRSWIDARPNRQAWLQHTVRPAARWWAHNLIPTRCSSSAHQPAGASTTPPSTWKANRWPTTSTSSSTPGETP